MISTNLMKPKSSFAKRRLIVIFLTLTMFAVSVVTGFSKGLNSDGTVYTPKAGERIVMWQEVPTSGTPEDHDLISNFKYVAQKLYSSSYYQGETIGKVIANVGMGIKYTQNVHNTRVVKGGIIFAEAISTSAAKSVAEQKYFDLSDGKTTVLYRPSASVKGDSAVWQDVVNLLKTDDFFKSYGVIPNELCKYSVNDTTVLSVKDDNASYKAAANEPNADDDGETGGALIDVPQTLVADEDGNYKITLSLDAVESTKYYRNEVRTLAGADQNPVFHSVSLTVVFNGSWQPVSVTTTENYDIAIPVLGAMNCTATLTETFADFDTDGDIPYYDFFKDHINDATMGDITQQLSPADYLANAFAKYIDGSSTLDMTANITVGGTKISNVKLSVDIGDMTVKVKLGDLSVQYMGDKAYVTLHKIKGYLPADKVAALAQDETLSALLSAVQLPDFDKLLGGDILTTVLSDCEITEGDDGMTRVRLPFELDGGIKVDASIYVKTDDLSLCSISGDITAFGTSVSVNARPASVKFPAVDDSYVDLSPVLDFVPDGVNTALGKTYGISGTAEINGYKLGVDAYIDRTNGLAMDANIAAYGQNINVKLIDERAYIQLGNIKLTGTADELPELINTAIEAMGIDLGKLDSTVSVIKMMLPKTVADYINMIDSLKTDGNSLTVGLNFLTVPIDVRITRNDGKIDGAYIDVNTNAFGIVINADIDLAITTPQPRPIAPNGNYITATELSALLDGLRPYLSAKYYDMEITGNIAGEPITGSAAIDRLKGKNGNETVSASADISALGKTLNVALINDVVYLDVDGIRIKAAMSDISELADAITAIANGAGTNTTADPVSAILAAIGAVKSLSVSNGAVVADLALGGYSGAATLDTATGALKVDLKQPNGTSAALAVKVKTTDRDHAIAVSGEYSDISRIMPALDRASELMAARSVSGGIRVDLGDAIVSGDLTVAFGDSPSAKLSDAQIQFGGETVRFELTLINGIVYLSVGEINVCGGKDDMAELLNALGDAIPQNVKDALMGILCPAEDNDAVQTVKTILNGIKILDIGQNGLTVKLSISGAEVEAVVPYSLASAHVSFTTEKISGTADSFDIAAGGSVTLPDKDYVSAAKFAAPLSAVSPLIGRDGYEIGIRANISGVTAVGKVQIDVAGKAVKLDVIMGDLPVTVALINGQAYISVGGDSVNITSGTTKDELTAILMQLDAVVPGLYDKVMHYVDIMMSLTSPQNILQIVSMNSTADGFALNTDLTSLGIDMTAMIELGVSNGAWNTLAVSGEAFGDTFAVKLDVKTDDAGVLSALVAQSARPADDGDAPLAAFTLINTDKQTVSVSGEFVRASDLTSYIAPLYDLAKAAVTAKTITLDIDAFALTKDNAKTDVDGTVTLAMSPLAVSADLTLFAGTDNAEKLAITYTENTLYIKSGEIMLSFDTVNDIDALLELTAKYLPEYLNDELAKLFGKKAGASIFSDISLLIERLQAVSKAESAADKITLLFGGLNGLNGNSAVKTLFDTVRIFAPQNSAHKLGASATVMGVTVNITPVITEYTDADGVVRTALENAHVSSTLDVLGGLYVDASVKIGLSDTAATIARPINAADYVSIIEFIKTIDNAAGTFTKTDADGNITFELKTFMFDYEIYKLETVTDENGNTVNVKDESGRDKPYLDENGNKVIDKTITVSGKGGASALKGKLERHETIDDNGCAQVEYKLNLEAHITIAVNTFVHISPIDIDLYVLNNADHPQGLAYLDYMESNGNGERISIDYASVMQIAAAVLDILGVSDDTVETLLGDYRQQIDKTVFSSMDIAGVNDLRVALDGIAAAMHQGVEALNDVKSAWDSVKTAGDTATLRARFPQIKAKLDNALASLKSVIAAFGADAEQDTPNDNDANAHGILNGKLYKDIVNGVSFRIDGNCLNATIDNAITTGASGEATVAVTQSGNKVDSIAVGDLDVNTAYLRNFTANFTAGETVIISLPDGYDTDTANAKYSDFGNIKHLLFDVMNTANLMEFEIGDTRSDTAAKNKSDKIVLNIALGKLDLVTLYVNYNVKVKIIDQGVGADPRYKTAAVVEFVYKKDECSALGATAIPDCKTYLYFYDNVMYVRGVQSWSSKYVIFQGYQYTVNYIDAMYTLEDISNVMKSENGTEKFMRELMFYLLPLSTDFTAFKINMQQEIINAALKMTMTDTYRTFAQVFKEYAYTEAQTDGNNEGKHMLKVGLMELTGLSDFSDLTLELTGKNDGDDNILDNYVSKMFVGTKFVNMVELSLHASLNNVQTYADGDVQKIRSSGLTDTVDGYSIDGIINSVIPATAWQRIWA